MKVGVPKEVVPNERRVALTPDATAKLGLEVIIETGAGAGAFFSDAQYEKAGAKIVPEVFSQADIVVQIHKPQVERLREGTVVIAMSLTGLEQSLAARKVTGFSMEKVPRISRAQSMDALSSQANIAGYKAVLIAAETLSKFFPMLTTAAGTIFPAKVLVLGAGVAGLQAIATARRLGAVVWGYDVRPIVKEQVESLGAKFLEFDLGEKDSQDKGGYAKELSPEAKQKQQDLLAQKTKEFDVVITTALIPGRPAPRLITKETVAGMRPGSVIVDLAAEAGGNCEGTQPGKTADVGGVIIHGPLNLPSTMPVHASQLYARNVSELLKLIVKDGALNVDLNDEIVKAARVS